MNYTFGFDADGNLIDRFDNLAHANDRHFGYDEAHRLTTATSPLCPPGTTCVDAIYTYDRNGNRLSQSESGVARNHTYATGTNRLATTNLGVSLITYTYDAVGNTTWDGVHSYAYNDAGRLAHVDEGVTANYIYDGEGRRVRKATASGTTYYFYDQAGRLLTEMTPPHDDGTGVGKDYIYVNDAPLAKVDWSVSQSLDECPPGLSTGECEPTVLANAALYYYHTDHLGTPIAMTAGNGSIVWRAADLPFGGGTPTGSAVNNLRFPGQYFDSETGLHQNWFRDYQPKTGRYQEADPIGLAGGTNPFSYVSGRPTRVTDRRGLCGENDRRVRCGPKPPAYPAPGNASMGSDLAWAASVGWFEWYQGIKNFGSRDYKTRFPGNSAAEPFGNFSFGATAYMQGLSDLDPDFIQWGAGVYSIWSNLGRPPGRRAPSAGIPVPMPIGWPPVTVGPIWPYGDDVSDAEEIESGIRFAKWFSCMAGLDR